jgi:hypothetical protein
MAHRRAWSGPASTDWFVSHLAVPGVSAVLGCRYDWAVVLVGTPLECIPAGGGSPAGRNGKRPCSVSTECILVHWSLFSWSPGTSCDEDLYRVLNSERRAKDKEEREVWSRMRRVGDKPGTASRKD